MVAGIAPCVKISTLSFDCSKSMKVRKRTCDRMMFSTFKAVSRLAGKGIPCVMIVDSSATTGWPFRRAAATSADVSTKELNAL